jgi:excisionase family DNA binding protein
MAVAGQPMLLTVREVADSMRVSTMTVYRLIRSGTLPAIRVGKHFRVRARDFDAFLTAQAKSSADTESPPAGRIEQGYEGGDAWPAA